MQWFELRNREEAIGAGADTRYYAKSPNFDRISVDSIIPGYSTLLEITHDDRMEVVLVYDAIKMEWALHGVGNILHQIRSP